MGEIKQFMIEEHGKILALFVKFKKQLSKDSFNELKTNLDRHVLAEERAITILVKNKEEFKEIAIILEQHEEIRDLMNKIAEKVNHNLGGFEDNLKNLLALMKTHINLENTKFYPELDKKLDPKEREVIYKKLHDYIIGGIGI